MFFLRILNNNPEVREMFIIYVLIKDIAPIGFPSSGRTKGGKAKTRVSCSLLRLAVVKKKTLSGIL